MTGDLQSEEWIRADELLALIAQAFPIYYAIVLQQHAFHNFILNNYGISTNTLIGSSLTQSPGA